MNAQLVPHRPVDDPSTFPANIPNLPPQEASALSRRIIPFMFSIGPVPMLQGPNHVNM